MGTVAERNSLPRSLKTARAADREELGRGVRWLPTSGIASILVGLLYLAVRTWKVVSTGQTDIVIWAVLLIEIAVAGPRFLIFISHIAAANGAKGFRAPQAFGDNDELPRVDVFITYCGEGLDIVLDTAKASLAQDYPQRSFRVFVLDDSKSAEVATSVSHLKKQYGDCLHYVTREITPETRCKGANLNNGIEYSRKLAGGVAEFVAVLDVDMIPEPNWLRTILPHIVKDPTVGMVTPFQYFYNISAKDPLYEKPMLNACENVFHMQGLKDEVFCAGSGFAIRQSILEKMGGFPAPPFQFDILTSVSLSSMGWKTVYVRERLQWGLAPDNFASWIRQYQRWCTGVLMVGLYLSSNKSKQLASEARVGFIIWGVIIGWTNFAWCLILFLFPLLVLSGKALIPPSSLQTPWLFFLASCDFVLQNIHFTLCSSSMDYRAPREEGMFYDAWCAPLRSLVLFRYFVLPKLFGRPVPRFVPTGVADEAGRHEVQARKDGTSCKKIVLLESGTWYCIPILGFCLAALVVSIRGGFQAWVVSDRSNSWISLQNFQQSFGVRIAWPPLFLLWVVIAKNAYFPIRYAFAPPPYVKREDLLDRNEKTGEAHPKKKAKEAYLKPLVPLFPFIGCTIILAHLFFPIKA